MKSSRFTFEPFAQRVRVRVGGIDVADSERAMVLRETRLEPVIYFPREDVRMELLHRTEHVSYCPFKGNASYWTLDTGDRRLDNVMWGYEAPFEGAEPLGNYVAFYASRVDEWLEDELPVPLVQRDDYAGHANPLLAWLLNHAPLCTDAESLTEQFAQCLAGAGMSIARLGVVLQTLHPQLIGLGYRWLRGEPGVVTNEARYEVLEAPAFTNSPLRPIFDGEGGVRRRLEGPDPLLDYGIVKDLHEEGMTDYVAMPLAFSDGRLHALSMCTDRPGGFTDVELGNVYEVLAVLGALFEMHAMRQTGAVLLDTYLGHQAGTKVLDGTIRRGAGEDIKAVIAFCDLRDSTALASAMPRADYLGMLNQFFDCIAGAMLEHHGEVLRFIGDAVLAIFPVTRAGDQVFEDGDEARAAAVQRAVEAATVGAERLAELNLKRCAKGREVLRFGMGLHLGDVTYGNIGTRDRLEFTVIGEAANAAARIEDLCKVLGEPLLVSESVARYLGGRTRDVGRHGLRGVGDQMAIHAVDAVKMVCEEAEVDSAAAEPA